MHIPLFTVIALFAANAAIALPETTTASCRKPSVRHEWRALGKKGQQAFADALKCLAQLPHNPSLTPTYLTANAPALNPNSSRYDDVVYTHIDAVDTAHFTGRFFPWHRIYLHTVETVLQSECGYKGTIPYWDWTLDSKDIKHSPIFNSDPKTGLGVFPEAKDGYNLSSGAFAKTLRVYPVPHYLQRNYTLKPFERTDVFPWTFNLPEKNANETQTRAEQKKIISSFVGNFTAFQTYIDGFRAEGLHNAAHLSVGGDLSNVSHSPNDPLFWLLHGMLDRVWALWQAANPANLYSVGGGEVQALDDFDNFPAGKAPWVNKTTVLRLSNLAGPGLEGKTVADVLNTQGGLLCYIYA